MSAKQIAQKVFNIEIASLQQVAASLDEQFGQVVSSILQSADNKVVVIGMGKSGHIARKISATLSSTGTPSFFLHPAEAFHGDLGMIGKGDVLILISFSGETDEILKLIPFLKSGQNKLIAMTSNPKSILAQHAHHHLHIAISQEACPLELAPTSSTTATLVMGDALALALMQARGFTAQDFARFHPGGNLGRKLLTRVKDLMRMDNLPFIPMDAHFNELIIRMSEGRLGMVLVGTPDQVTGIITDGDLRRALLQDTDTNKLKISKMMTVDPIIIGGDVSIVDAEDIMLEKKVTTLLVGVPEQRSVCGVYQIYTMSHYKQEHSHI